MRITPKEWKKNTKRNKWVLLLVYCFVFRYLRFLLSPSHTHTLSSSLVDNHFCYTSCFVEHDLRIRAPTFEYIQIHVRVCVCISISEPYQIREKQKKNVKEDESESESTENRCVNIDFSIVAKLVCISIWNIYRNTIHMRYINVYPLMHAQNL